MAWADWVRRVWPTQVLEPVELVEPTRTPAQAALLLELKGYLKDANVQAGMRVVRAGESREDNDEAYRWLFGSTRTHPLLFDSFADHPRQWFPTKWGNTSAAGAYQAMCAVPGHVKTDTWGDFIKAVGPMDFTPMSQDIFAVWCFRRHGAVRDLVAGDLVIALDKIRLEWASMPSSTYGQPRISLNRAGIVFEQYGGIIRRS